MRGAHEHPPILRWSHVNIVCHEDSFWHSSKHIHVIRCRNQNTFVCTMLKIMQTNSNRNPQPCYQLETNAKLSPNNSMNLQCSQHAKRKTQTFLPHDKWIGILTEFTQLPHYSENFSSVNSDYIAFPFDCAINHFTLICCLIFPILFYSASLLLLFIPSTFFGRNSVQVWICQQLFDSKLFIFEFFWMFRYILLFNVLEMCIHNTNTHLYY